MPVNLKPVHPFGPERHLDLQADLHTFFDWLVAGKRVLDVGAGLGKSKARIRHSRVTTYDPAPAVAHLVDLRDLTALAFPAWDVATAFEVIEHVQDDRAFLRLLERCATQAVFLTSPNWDVARCQSAQHYREYTAAEWVALLEGAFPKARIWWGRYRKDGEGGWGELLPRTSFLASPGLKHLALVDKGLSAVEASWLLALVARSERAERRDV